MNNILSMSFDDLILLYSDIPLKVFSELLIGMFI